MKKETKQNIIQGSGFFLIIEAVISVVASEDQRIISQVGRGIRMVIGAWLMSQ